jgi:uncharacterized membrane protein YgcG
MQEHVAWENLPPYDTAVFVLPVALKNPASLMPTEVVGVVEYSMAQAKEDTNFTFLPANEDKGKDGGADTRGSGNKGGSGDEHSDEGSLGDGHGNKGGSGDGHDNEEESGDGHGNKGGLGDGHGDEEPEVMSCNMGY